MIDVAENKTTPPARRSPFPVRVEVALLIACITCFTMLGLVQLMKVNGMLILAVAAGLVGLVTIWLGGTRVCLPLYLATAFGDALPLPGAPAGISINQCLALAVLAAFVVDVIRFKAKLPFRLAHVLFLIFAVYVLTAAVILKPPQTEYPIQAAYYLFLTLIITALFWRSRWLNVLLGGIVVVGMLLLVVPGFVEFATGKNYMLNGKVLELLRLDGLAKDSVIFASVCVWMLFFAIYLTFSARLGLARLMFGICIPLIVAVALLTFNRQTPILIAFCITVMLIFMRSKYKYLMGGLILVAGLAVAPLFVPALIERFAGAKSILTDHSLTEHHDKAEIAKEAFIHHPVFGIGHGAFKDVWHEYIPYGKIYGFYETPRNRHAYVDMGYLQILTEYGIVGSVILLAFFVAVALLFLRCYRLSLRITDPAYTNIMAMCAALFAQLFVSLFVRDAFLTPQTCVVFGVFFAACTAVEHAFAQQQEGVPATAPCPA
ncbi:O-antigen ligase family protein [Candidatus Sumerlaeota bacterium]|nr:O-antigen ligase family protein [Candidatus Sumerlaeota bacterium]